MIFLRLFLLAAGLNILLGWHGWPAVFAGSLDDPDSYMRLVRLQQGIHAGHLTVTVARDQSGAGVYVEWSRLLDMLLWPLALPLAPFIGWHKALFVAGVALGPLGVGCLGMVLAWAVEPFSARPYLWSAAAAAALFPSFINIAEPGMVHYHILLLVLVALTGGCVARAWRDDRWYGFLAGLAGGFAIWLTPETMPFVLASYAVLLLRWCQTSNGFVLLTTAAGCFDVLLLGFFIDPPSGGYGVPAVDRLSLVYVTMALLLLAGTLLLARLQARLGRGRAAIGVVLLGGLMAVWIYAFPRVAMGPYGLMPPDQASVFFGAIMELQRARGLELVVFLFPGLCAVLYALWRGLAHWGVDFEAMVAGPMLLGLPPRQRVLWLYIAGCGVVSLLLGARFLLFTGFAALFAAALLPVALSQASSALAATPRRAILARGAILALIFAVPAAAAIAIPAPPRVSPSCTLRHIAPLLTPFAGQVVLAPPEDTPELLYRTQVETVGSLYQHGIAGYLRDRAAWRAVPGVMPPPEVIATQAAAILFCPSGGRYALVQDLPPDTLWDALQATTPPPWLSLAGTNADGWRLYKITP